MTPSVRRLTYRRLNHPDAVEQFTQVLRLGGLLHEVTLAVTPMPTATLP